MEREKGEGALIFTDGSSRGNPGPGGWAYILRVGGRVVEGAGREARTTNNRMEIRAAAEALAALPGGQAATVVTDSSYLANGASKWLVGWRRKGWKTATGQDVKNADLWEKMNELLESRKVSWRLVLGHAGVAANHRCDELATGAADGTPLELYDGPASGYRVSLEAPAPGTQTRSGGADGKRAYSYLSMVDGEIKRHNTWPECERRVRGVAGTRYRKTFSAEDEAALVASWEADGGKKGW
jgi:ribonuclease HI